MIKLEGALFPWRFRLVLALLALRGLPANRRRD